MPASLRRSLVIGNWKMHGSVGETETLLRQIMALCETATAEVAVCPSFVHVPLALRLTAASAIAVGCQNCSEHDAGACTGEVAAAMLADLGCDRVILGHSERRRQQGESSALVAAKCRAAHRAGLKAVVCVGETLEQREMGQAQTVVAEQLQALVEELMPEDVIAYEPVWAIGTGHTASSRQAQEMHAFIRGYLGAARDDAVQRLRLLYGGSVKAANAAELFAQQDIDGGLVGGAALDAQEFAAIVALAG